MMLDGVVVIPQAIAAANAPPTLLAALPPSPDETGRPLSIVICIG